MRHSVTGVALAFLVATGCGEGFLTPSDFEGMWDASSIVVTNRDNVEQSVDLIEESMGSLTIEFSLNTYSAMLVVPGRPDEEFNGAYTVESNMITLTSFGHNVTVLDAELENSDMILTDDNIEWDFEDDGTQEAATLTMTLVK